MGSPEPTVDIAGILKVVMSDGILFAALIELFVAGKRDNRRLAESGDRTEGVLETKRSDLRLTWLTVELLGVVSREWVARGLVPH